MVQRHPGRAGLALLLVATWLAPVGSAVALPKLPFLGHGADPRATAHSDLQPDPDIRSGVLDNGMRFFIMHSAQPPGAASVRLRIAAGSLEESDAQRGVARFLARLAFDGSKNIPAGGLAKFLQDRGLTFSADNDALTTFDATAYRLDIAKTDDSRLDSALMMLREVAAELTLTPEMISQERGAVISEARSSNTAAYRIYAGRLVFLLAGQRPPQRFPLGEQKVLETAKRGQIVDFYNRFYRPERAVLIAVGDFDPAAMEARIRSEFSSWRGTGAAGGGADAGRIARRGPESRLVVETGAPPSVQVSWAAPPDRMADSAERRRRELVQDLGMTTLTRRLAAIAGGRDAPFGSAAAFEVEEAHAAEVTSLLAIAPNPDWRVALATLDQEQRRAAQQGISDDELAKAIAEKRASLTDAAGQAGARNSPALADGIEDAVADGRVITSPAEDLVWFEAAVKTIGSTEVSAALKSAFAGSGPLVFVTAPAAIDGGEAAISAEYAKDAAAPLAAPAHISQKEWPYLDFGEPGKVAEQKDLLDLDAVQVRFANGARLIVKPTKLKAGEVLVRVRVAGGRLALPTSSEDLDWAGGLLTDGGFGRINMSDAQQALAANVWSDRASLEDPALILAGTTRREDIDTELQVLAATLTDPGWGAGETKDGIGKAAIDADTNGRDPTAAIGRSLPALVHGPDRRWTAPTGDEIRAARPDDLKRTLSTVASGPIEVTVVGDVTVDEAIKAVSATIGALPARTDTPAIVNTSAPPPGAMVTVSARDKPGHATAVLAWRGGGYDAGFDTPTAAVLATLLRSRVAADVNAAADAPAVTLVLENEAGWGLLGVRLAGPSPQVEAAIAGVAKASADLREREVGAAELDAARQALLASLEAAHRSNDFWVRQLSGAASDPRRLRAIRSQEAALQRITPAQVMAAAQRLLTDQNEWKLTSEPAGV